ncbi:MAG: GNAT family N-acetyltransferase, partial [Cyanobacteria bacterium J06642_11]
MIELKQYSPDTLPLPLKYQLLAAVRIEWAKAFTGPSRTWDYIHKSTRPCYFTVSEQDILISFAEVNQRSLHHANESYKLYGLSAVYTFPAYRHEGYGQQVVQAATDYIGSSDADVAMLFCSPALIDFYRASGWQALPTATIHYGDPDQPSTNKDVVMTQFVSSKGRQHQPIFTNQPVYVG